MNIDRFKRLPVLGILRGVEEGPIDGLVETMVSGGLQTVEVAMNTRGAPGIIKRALKAARGRLVIGAGTVLTTADMDLALDSGASFIVMPVLVNDVIERCVKNRIPVFPGALSPQEIFNAWRSGATMVKVFPAGFFGPEYFREIKGPFQDIELLACGGVNGENVRSFFLSGASAVAFGSSIFRKEWIGSGDFVSPRDITLPTS